MNPKHGKVKLGVSACLLGKKVRYDGGHKKNRFVAALGRRFQLIPLCPEIEAGLSIPREPMRLEGARSCPRLVVIGSCIDLTSALNAWAEKKAKQLAKEKLCGLVLKSRSPSCAINDADLFTASGKKKGKTAGIFTAVVMRHDPNLPLINEEDLEAPALRKNFIKRVQCLPQKVR